MVHRPDLAEECGISTTTTTTTGSSIKCCMRPGRVLLLLQVGRRCAAVAEARMLLLLRGEVGRRRQGLRGRRVSCTWLALLVGLILPQIRNRVLLLLLLLLLLDLHGISEGVHQKVHELHSRRIRTRFG